MMQGFETEKAAGRELAPDLQSFEIGLKLVRRAAAVGPTFSDGLPK